ncbi:MAG: (Fe-S)-binding protein [Candidatus Thiodiazotropha lotti]|uniref:Heterodisulfide reductase n=1 Tax=Candidatus Thiodiazotropha endoloripes TaxID=1818881 RepID=A0A1E2UT92_9GAMM|nr:(Fe-S)-binding protein [Candidatus Thiodiazotropha endoloripes]MCG7898540.1 (Fe-S)-binding protein [Candidatus Thiodiazotropha weberae]MCG7990831.1 (Fe-S)-binding protein [Candidatus Thiodiazotropha lotti]MCG7901463.1 (Fe-S)-binding protein [Candidatus Thiodiazotropha weberae]MCG7999305.1 (Fe-S)-binding protein [Candidatus Thiodiazotropha lotti]MCW4182485.1 (Fe-S)-binding protein [Candidatus Thiodiazotropha weberae]
MSEATLERGMNAFREQMNAPVASFFSSCVNCGMCAEACLFYTETGDPKYTPIHKLEPLRRVWEQEYTLWGRLKSMLGLSKPVTDELLEEWETLIYDGCTLCGRCSMVCPVGNDISYMIRRAREGFVAAGYAPEGIKGASRRAITIGSPMGVKFPALAAQIKHVEADSGLTIPVDVEGADYMALLSSMEIMNFPEYLEALAKIFKQAGVTWTISSEAFEATNSGIQIGSSDIARELVNRVVVAAEKLKVKYVISPECGHAYTAIRWEGPNLIGRPYDFKVVHILELLDELRSAGRLKTEGTEDDRLTFHDPCQIVRKGGVLEPPRNLLNMVATNFVDMNDSREMNWCCGGGGGVSANERAEELRIKAFKRKKTQLDELNVETLVTACANCRLIIEEGLEEYRMEMPVVGLTEMIAEHLVEDEK